MNLSINEIIIYLMVLFMVLGAVDRILGNRFGLGEKFEEGIMNMGALALSMIGIICLAPVLADVLRPVVGKHHFCGQYEMRLSAEKYRIDFAVNTTDGRRIALELDGFRTHVQEMDPEQFGRQLRRQNELVLAGWQVLRFSFRQLTQEAEACRQMVRRALTSNRPPVFTPQPPFRSLGDSGPGKRGAPAKSGSARRGT